MTMLLLQQSLCKMITWVLDNLFGFQGQRSSDEEELDDVPDDDEYDTEDSFIDDAELVGSFSHILIIQVVIYIYILVCDS